MIGPKRLWNVPFTSILRCVVTVVVLLLGQFGHDTCSTDGSCYGTILVTLLILALWNLFPNTAQFWFVVIAWLVGSGIASIRTETGSLTQPDVDHQQIL